MITISSVHCSMSHIHDSSGISTAAEHLRSSEDVRSSRMESYVWCKYLTTFRQQQRQDHCLSPKLFHTYTDGIYVGLSGNKILGRDWIQIQARHSIEIVFCNSMSHIHDSIGISTAAEHLRSSGVLFVIPQFYYERNCKFPCKICSRTPIT